MLRVLIVDDELIARKVLREELACLDGLIVVGESENGERALIDISALKPDLLLLDVQMPLMSGFDVLRRLDGGHMPAVIMVTAFDHHAISAFDAGAVDYLLKPVGQERLRLAVERATRVCRRPKVIAENIAQLQQQVSRWQPSQVAENRNQKIVGRSGHEYFLLNSEEVLAFHSNGDSVTIITGKQRYLATQNLRTLEERLGQSSFRRIHRNALVNINQIRKISMITSQRWLLTLNNGEELVVSKRQARHVREALNW